MAIAVPGETTGFSEQKPRAARTDGDEFVIAATDLAAQTDPREGSKRGLQ
jgi:hypothetical protein